MIGTSVPSIASPVHLLDGNVLSALIDEEQVDHAAARRWFAGLDGAFATCPIKQGTLLRLTMRLGGQSIEQASAVLKAVTANARHRFWADALGYPVGMAFWATGK